MQIKYGSISNLLHLEKQVSSSMAVFRVSDFDIIYLSYDEPNAEENYADLLRKVPWAKRVHGIEGSDAAHKACAELSETKRFITIDGDNKIHHGFIDEVIDFKEDIDLENSVISWSGYNIVNGLTYGNGGIKCWPKDVVLNMRTHENADPNNPNAQVDFCWDLNYVQVSKTYSEVYNNATPQQAWRAGFREGVKMSLHEGVKLDTDVFSKRVHRKNLQRLKIWQTVGMDVPNGIWAIYGAREGCYKTNCTDWDYVNVRDFEYLNDLWNNHYSKIPEDQLRYEIMGLGETLRHELDLDIPVDPYDDDQSKFFKSVYINPERVAVEFEKTETSDYDIVMISYDEPDCEENYQELKKRFPRAKRIHGVKGIHQAHIEAAKLCTTELFWAVDGDAQIVDDFNFDYASPDDEKDFVKVWRSRNPINDLEYGYGGVKLLPRSLTEHMDTSKPDMTTSISRKFKPIQQVSNITAFNSDEFRTWRSAFRECTKLSSKTIARQKNEETEKRLEAWTTRGHDRRFGQYALDGARAGMEFGISNGVDLRVINDFDWLREQFNNYYYPKDDKEYTPAEIKNSAKEYTPAKIAKDDYVKDMLDRFEILYEGDLSNVRRFYNDGDLSSIFKLSDNDELRKAVIEKNLHSIFRLLDINEDFRKAVIEKNLHSVFRLLPINEDFRKAVVEKNIHSIFRLTDADEDLRKAVVEENLHSIFRVVDADEDLRKAVIEENLHSIFRLTNADDDLRKAVVEENLHSLARLMPDISNEFKLLNNDKLALYNVLEKYTDSKFVKPLKYMHNQNIAYDKDCFSRGQIASKKWLVDTVKDLDLDLGLVYLCAGWYATIVPMLLENSIKFDAIRSFDIDPDVWQIAEIFNKDLLLDGWKFKAQTKDIFDINYHRHVYTTIKSNGIQEECKDSPDTIVNTSCEHIENFEEWFAKIPNGKLVILQSNNYYSVEEHVNCVKDSLHFAQMAPFSTEYFTGELPLDKYTRFMRIGRK